MTNALDSLAKLATATGFTPDEIAAKVGTDPATVRAWIDGTARPGDADPTHTHAVFILLCDARIRNTQRRGSAVRDQELAMLLVALQTPAQRKTWLAKRAQMRRQFAR